ncbi:hypothetical protein SEPCBS57363_002980 [Sporothrix epigloea]|uniref:7alpha-cephem-methoxylase P8 chain related protein n=1 Tax=Sporothrix epigloea TaxID=1892477 RepID=A0ABP0DKM3_9PEZI
MTTSGIFRYADPATIADSDVPFVKPWAKVDTDVTSFARTEVSRPVHNVRDAPVDQFSVDSSGFALFHAPVEEQHLANEDAIRDGYYAEVEALVRAKLSTSQEPVNKVVIFDHTVRRRNPSAPRQPVQQVHVDQTPGAAEARVRRHAGNAEEVEVLLQSRYQIINVWRPIGYAAADHPLAFIDYRTASLNDLKSVDLLYPNQPGSADIKLDMRRREALPDPTRAMSTEGYSIKGETYTVVPSDEHCFYYVKDMKPEEALFIKCIDSRSEVQHGGRRGVSAWTPHTAFTDPATPADAKGRQSIEVRCLVFYSSSEKSAKP